MYTKIKTYRNTVVIYYSKNGKVLRYNTNIRINQYFKNGSFTTKDPDYVSKNESIAVQKRKVENIIQEYVRESGYKPPVGFITSELDKDKQSVNIVFSNVIDWYNLFLEYKTNSAISRPSLRDYKSLLNALKLYQYINGKLQVNQINTKSFFDKFETFLSTKHEGYKDKFKTEGGLNHNTVRKRISSLKSFLYWLDEKDIIKMDKGVQRRKSLMKKYNPTIVRLNKSELSEFMNTEVKPGKEQKLKDMFLFLCCTGMRYSDAITITHFDVINGTIKRDATKTDEPFEVPLNRTAKKILAKYNYDMSLFAIQKFNEGIKQLLRKYNLLTNEIRIVEKRGNETRFIYTPKYLEISSHTGRRTFISRCVEEGIPLNKIMKYTGHKKIDTLLYYMDVFGTKDDNAIELLNVA